MTTTRSFTAATGFAALITLIPITASGVPKGLTKQEVGKAIAGACDVTRTKVERISAKLETAEYSNSRLAESATNYIKELDALMKSLKALKVSAGSDGGRIKKIIEVLGDQRAYFTKLIESTTATKDSAGKTKALKALETLDGTRNKSADAAQALANDLKKFGYTCSLLPDAK
jgi:hypothetical protein